MHVVAKQERTFGDDSWPIFPVLFQNSREGIDKDRSRGIDALYTILMLKNVHSISKLHLIQIFLLKTAHGS